MNQILQVQENRKKSKSIDMKKIIIFFAVCILIFGAVLAGQGVYSFYLSKVNEKVNPSTPEPDKQQQEYIPTIILTKTEENKLIINIENQIAISHIIYSWNNEAAITLEETGKTYIEEIIDIPVGENIFNISVIDSNGKETKKTENYIIEAPKPVIELSVVGNNIKITVTSEEKLSYITYKWNNEQEKKEDMLTYQDKTKFEKEIEIPKGQNTLKILAVDEKNNKSEKVQEIKGVAKLKDPIVKAKDGYLHFTFEAEENMKLVEFLFNGQQYVMNTETFGQTKTVHYKIKMVEGWNYLKLIGTTESGVKNTSVWKYEYKSQ